MSSAISTGTEKEERHYREVLKGGAIGGSMGLALGLGGVWAASTRYPAFRSLTLPFRTFLVTSSATFGAIVNADRYSHMFAHAQNPMADYKDVAARLHAERLAQMTFKDRAMAWGQENRYSIVFASWVASMGVALAIVGRAPMSTSQKVVQARVYAQGLTLAVLILSAAFEMNDAKKGSGRWETVMELDPNDPEHKKLIERKIHKEEYEGQDLWRDMVAAEERRIADRDAAEAAKNKNKSKSEPKSDSKAQPQTEKA